MAPRQSRILFAVIISFSVAAVAATDLVIPFKMAFEPLATNCSTAKYAKDSLYQVNLANLMDDLRFGGTANGGFNYSVAGEAPDAVYGLIMCYADRNLTACKACVQAAATGVQNICPYSTEMKAIAEDCMIRYSNESFFTVADLTPPFNIIGIGAMDSTKLVAEMTTTMNATRWSLRSQLLVQAAVSDPRLANGSLPYKDSQSHDTLHRINGLAQCTRDLNASECTKCLTEY